jgi:hypothetical protein
MARSTGEVQADIAVMRRVIERKLDTLHDRLHARWWLSYAWVAGDRCCSRWHRLCRHTRRCTNPALATTSGRSKHEYGGHDA